MQTIYIITTSETVEKWDSESLGGSGTVQYLKLLRLPQCDLRVIPLRNKGGLEVTQESRLGDSQSAGRDRISLTTELTILLPEENPIVITHGTDTMIETGLYLQREFVDLEVPVILTGAMTPHGFEGSDGLQNLTESLLAARLLGPGVFVVLHGQVFPANRVRKDQGRGTFVRTDELEASR